MALRRLALHAAALRRADQAQVRDIVDRVALPEDIDDARRVADQLDIPFYVLDASARFRSDVIDPFVAAYRQGQTPLPCAACNRSLKFGHLLRRARALSARLCTGHYARIGAACRRQLSTAARQGRAARP